jgi:DNA-binding MarR family transcriptional regulator
MNQNHERLIIAILKKSEQFKDSAMVKSKVSDLTTRQLHCLEIIHGLKHPTPSALARAMNISRPSATTMIDKLVGKTYVEKVKSDRDRRVAHVHLTRKGLRASQWDEEIYRDFATYLIKDLSGEEIYQLEKMLSKALMKFS